MISFTILIIWWLLKIVVYLFIYSSLYTHVLWTLSHFINIYNWTVWSEICLGNNMISWAVLDNSAAHTYFKKANQIAQASAGRVQYVVFEKKELIMWLLLNNIDVKIWLYFLISRVYGSLVRPLAFELLLESSGFSRELLNSLSVFFFFFFFWVYSQSSLLGYSFWICAIC